MRFACLAFLTACLVGLPAHAQETAGDGYAKAMELFHAGSYEQALPYFQRELDLAEARHGPDDPAIAVSLNNLAEANRLAGRLDEAEALYRRALELDVRAGRQAEPDHAISLNNLAMVYRDQKRLDEAERLYVQSLALLERSVGASHPDIARSLNNLAMLYRAKGEPDRARPLQERAVALATEALGPRNPITEQLRRNLAALEPPVAPVTLAPKAKPTPAVTRGADLPALAPAAISRPEPAAGPSFSVQVAAIREAQGAQAELKRLARRYPVLKNLQARAPEKVEVPGKGTFYRVFAGNFATAEDAAAVCAQLRTGGISCRTVRR